MLVLSRKVGEKIQIGDEITVVVSRISGNRITIGIDAPRTMRIVRGELERFEDGFEKLAQKKLRARPQNGTSSIGAVVALETAGEEISYAPRRAR